MIISIIIKTFLILLLFLNTYIGTINNIASSKIESIFIHLKQESYEFINLYQNNSDLMSGLYDYVLNPMDKYIAQPYQKITGTIIQAGIDGTNYVFDKASGENNYLTNHGINSDFMAGLGVYLTGYGMGKGVYNGISKNNAIKKEVNNTTTTKTTTNKTDTVNKTSGGVKGTTSNETLDVLKDAIKDPHKGKSKIYEKSGGYKQAEKDFEKITGKNPRDISNDVKISYDSNGNTVNLRKNSSDGRITIEIQKGPNNKIKIRYD